MHYIHQSYQSGETIAAIATPIGEGGVAIIRISGSQAIEVAGRVFSKPINHFKSHTVHYGNVLTEKGVNVDSVLLIIMRGPRSYTGEDTVEIHCHGGSLITRRVLEAILSTGARQAFPGEFTFKAFMNGKMDLAQAEAVQQLIVAKNEKAVDAAKNQLDGALSVKIKNFQSNLTHIAAILEAWVDFPEEGLEFASFDEICFDLNQTLELMQKLIDTFHNGQMIQHGISLCLVGKPNVGKSSLMNALLDKNRAIVSHIPGTTRDLIEDHLQINGMNFRLIDTAGIRQTEESIEIEGIERSKEALSKADLVLLVLDAQLRLSEQDHELLGIVPKGKTILVWNKSDISKKSLPFLDLPYVILSAKYRQGIEELYQKIDEVIWKEGLPSQEEVLITNVRHKEALDLAIEAGKRVLDGLRAGTSPEFLSIDMRECLRELGKLIGTDVTEDILSSIFSKFCIGK